MARNFFHEPESGSGKHHSSGIDVTDWDGNLLSAWVEVGEPTIWSIRIPLGLPRNHPFSSIQLGMVENGRHISSQTT